jgi:hypothetical protein
MRGTLLLAVAAAASLAGCRSAWTRAGLGTMLDPASAPPHRAVEHATLRVAEREFEFLGYRACDPVHEDARIQLVLDSGLSVIDVEVHRDGSQQHSGSVFESIPHFAEVVIDDLRHVWGSRSVFAMPGGSVDSFSGNLVVGKLVLDNGRAKISAKPLRSGAYAAIQGGDGAPLRVTILDADLVPEAVITYSDFEEGVPREIHLEDLVHEHTLDVEVEEVRFPNSEGENPALAPR